MASNQSNITTDHDVIRRWVEDRGGVPATVEGTQQRGKKAGLLRIDFPDDPTPESNLKPISWEEFFNKFEEQELAFAYQEETADGQTSRFNKLVRREQD